MGRDGRPKISKAARFVIWSNYGFLFGAALVFLTVLFPVLKFVPTLEWKESTWIIYGPGLALYSVAYTLARLDRAQELNQLAIWRRKLPKLEPTHPLSQFLRLLIIPPVFWFFSSTIVTHWIPMISVIAWHEDLSIEFTVKNKRYPRGIRMLELDGHYFYWGAIFKPPNDVWRKSARKTKVILTGTGNRYGVFYNTIEARWN